jgi:hypothetical protein
MKKTTVDLMQREQGSDAGLPAHSEQQTIRSLILAPPASLVPITAPRLPVPTSGQTLATRPAQHARCQCPSCRKRRARKRAARTRQQGTPYIETEVITISPWTDDRPAVQASSPAPSGPEQGMYAPWVGQPRRPGRRRRRTYLLMLASFALLLAVASFAVFGGPLLAALSSPTATITIIPASSQESLTVSVPAVTGRPGAYQVAARMVQATSPVRTAIARASGSGQTPATPASGTITFFNEGSVPQTVGAGTSITGADGIVVITDSAVTVPTGNLPAVGTAWVWAHSLQGGQRANIAVGDVSGLCCAPGLAVKNSAFSGGQDGQPYPVLQQSDIAAALESAAQGLSQQAQRLVEGQVSHAERLAADPQCHTSTSSPDAAGSHVAQTTVSVSATCTGEVYDRDSALSVGASLYAQTEARAVGPTYILSSRISTRITQVTLTDARHGTLAVLIQARGTWRYQFSAQQRLSMTRHIAGKPVGQALSLIAQEPGVAHTSISVTGGAQSIPTDPGRIVLTILPQQAAT